MLVDLIQDGCQSCTQVINRRWAEPLKEEFSFKPFVNKTLKTLKDFVYFYLFD